MSDEVQYTLKIWHKVKHDDYCVSEVYHQTHFETRIADLVRQGGFYMGAQFIPYHSISYIEIIEEQP